MHPQTPSTCILRPRVARPVGAWSKCGLRVEGNIINKAYALLALGLCRTTTRYCYRTARPTAPRGVRRPPMTDPSWGSWQGLRSPSAFRAHSIQLSTRDGADAAPTRHVPWLPSVARVSCVSRRERRSAQRDSRPGRPSSVNRPRTTGPPHLSTTRAPRRGERSQLARSTTAGSTRATGTPASIDAVLPSTAVRGAGPEHLYPQAYFASVSFIGHLYRH